MMVFTDILLSIRQIHGFYHHYSFPFPCLKRYTHVVNIVCILGRQPELSLAELEQRFGSSNLRPLSDEAAIVTTDQFDIQQLGGVQKAGRVIAELEPADWPRLSRDIANRYARELTGEGKLTLGISVYGRDVPARDVGRTGLAIKSALKKQGRSVRLVPNDAAFLSNATSHHNKLGLSPNKVELMAVYTPDSVLVAESVGAQNITALAARDQARPKTDAFVGMLPPKLALMMINMSGITTTSHEGIVSTEPSSGTQPESASSRREVRSDEIDDRNGDAERLCVLDPFCGTGVVLQEAALLGFNVYGTDLAEKMVDYSKANLDWLGQKHRIGNVRIEAGDAIEHTWQPPVHAVVAETYLGQPFSAPPAPDKLDKVRRVVDHIVSSFLQNLHGQLEPGTPLCLAVPAWRDAAGRMTHLSVISKLSTLGYEYQPLEHVDANKLAYFREDQVVARQLLILKTV